MSGDELYYLPDEFRESARVGLDSADAAESTGRYLRNARPDAHGFGGADAFVASLNATRDRQAREVRQAAEGRENMAGADQRTADIGEETDAAAQSALGKANSAVARAIADGM
ncbi:hypothetical protein [Streptomyces hoynatensis]|uniref:Uncharacterized protein n=1 Tax=Streptomyces hoynatensis TaxID=1141874 RepID=A0A3A9Z599_9ACTN|nr:hypothetical protein [Streptomyces hoynatensis]RKN43034.1 hypothetical protein D7294_11020 [Streptomyces hoynatensis]